MSDFVLPCARKQNVRLCPTLCQSDPYNVDMHSLFMKLVFGTCKADGGHSGTGRKHEVFLMLMPVPLKPLPKGRAPLSRSLGVLMKNTKPEIENRIYRFTMMRSMRAQCTISS